MVTLVVNGRRHGVESDPDTPLLYVLRDELGLHAAKYGCGLGQCGACTVMVDGVAVFSCVTPVVMLEDREIVTVEGLGTPEAPHPLQAAFLAEQAGQCGFCLPGILVSAAALLDRDPDPDDAAIRAALDPHLCRCGSHNRIIRAVRRAARAMREGRAAA